MLVMIILYGMIRIWYDTYIIVLNLSYVNPWINVTDGRVVDSWSYLMEVEIIIYQFTHGFLDW